MKCMKLFPSLMSSSGAEPATVTRASKAMGAYVSELYSEKPNLLILNTSRRLSENSSNLPL